jgi:hypothetical protein
MHWPRCFTLYTKLWISFINNEGYDSSLKAQREAKPQIGKKKFGTKLDEAHNLRRGELS